MFALPGRAILSLALATGWLFACSGDCIKCHPVLKKSLDKDYHAVIKRCIECHENSSTGTSECGRDCFECHSRKKLERSALPEHRAVKNCSKCHIDRESIKESIFDMNRYEDR